MAHPRTPDDLDELDRRVYDLAVQSIPLAEIAVRMGVPVPQADERIQRVCNRLGVADRAALRAGAGTAVSQPNVAAGPVIGLDFAIPDIDPEPPKHSRRAVLAGGAAALALFGGAAAVALTRRGGSPASPAATETPSREPSPTPPADDFGGLPIQVEGGLNQRFETRAWVKDAPIDWDHGLFRMFPNTGDVQGFRFIELEPPRSGQSGFVLYKIGPGGRFVWAMHGDGRAYLLDVLNTERSWSWPIEDLRLVTAGTASHGVWVVFEELESRQGTGRHHVFSAAPGQNLELQSSFELPPTGLGMPPLWSPDGSHLAIWSGGDTSDPQLHLIQASTGRIVQSSHVIPPRDGKAAWPMNLQQLDRGFGGFLAVWGYPANTPTASPPREGQLLLWSGAWTAQGSGRVMPLEWTSRFSPDGQYHLFEVPLRHVYLESGEGVREFWTAVSVSGLEASAPGWSMLSTSIGYGDGQPANPWLADSSGFVAMVRGPEPPDRPWDAYEYAIISTDGRTITRIPLPPVADLEWFRANSMRSPAPCPYDPDLIAFGRLELYNRRTGEWLTANITSQAGPDHLDPWAAGAGQIVFALPHGGHGGASPPILLTPKRVEGAADPEFRFVVARTGDGLNLRTGPSTGSDVIGVLPDGTLVELAEDVKMPVGQRGAIRNEEGTWLYVRTQSGEHGWVSAAYLDWA
ncbi:MAG: SH3 domain-containing protein [Dehalococcoidia bacterium]|nr:SH3 domain-containing protein [Dehalococcoidia bacterium]